ncbi:MAG TPA: chorismate-binding protein, partial [Gemmatimonadaceae bacterium]|nr:chorismate-binding protein [Gemmatimonadaceae bacterium]
MTVAHFQSFAEGRGWRAGFGQAIRHRTALTLDQVLPLLIDAEASALGGSWVALLVSYEAAPALDSAWSVKSGPGFPLAWMAVFDKPLATGPGQVANHSFKTSMFEPDIDRARYDAAVHAIKDYIEAGDTYQVNFTFPLRGSVTGDAWAGFQSIGRSQGAAYSAYVETGTHRILSFSPELFFETRGDQIVTRPMKGTMQRGRWLEEDLQRVAQLQASAKDRAENVMIVDLLRNDLGKVCEFGSVEVPE